MRTVPIKKQAAPAKTVRCAIYARKSTNIGMDKAFTSIDAQVAECTSYINMRESQGWELAATYSDVAISGATLERPQMQEMLAAARDGQFDCIVIYKLDRISRSMKDFANLMYEFDELGITLAITSQGFDTNTEIGRLSLSILASFAEFERSMIRSRIHDKSIATREAGLWPTAIRPYGYTLSERKLTVCPDEADLVQQCFNLFVNSNRTPTEIARGFNAENKFYTSPRKDGGVRPWDAQIVTNLLRARVYIGEMEYEGVVYPGCFEAIVDKPLWHAAVNKLDTLKAARKAHSRGQHLVFPLKGLIVCSHCGAKFASTFTHKGDVTHRYYVCPQHRGRAKTCPALPLSAAMIEDAVCAQMDKIMDDPMLRRALEAQLPGADRRDIADALYNYEALLSYMTLEQKRDLFHLTLSSVCYDEQAQSLNIEYKK